MSKTIYLDAPNVGIREKQYLAKAIDTGYVSSVGPFVSTFEEKFAQYVAASRAVSTQSGTAALHMALHELGIGKGDEVIVPAITFIATVNPILYLGATPVFVDVDRETWNIDPDAIERHITKRTKAIIPVHLYGNPCAMKRIMAIARKHGCAVIEDATESLGATYDGKHTGTFGEFGCFSFNGNKVITTGGGGMVIGKSARRLEHIKFLVNQARETSAAKGYYHPEVGFNYRMTNIEAALGLAQLERMKSFLQKKRLFNAIYRAELAALDGIEFPRAYPSAQPSYWLTCIRCDASVNVARLQKALQAQRIPVRRTFMPLPEFPCYAKFRKDRYAHAYEIFNHSICLPSSTLNTAADIVSVCTALKKHLTRRSGYDCKN